MDKTSIFCVPFFSFQLIYDLVVEWLMKNTYINYATICTKKHYENVQTQIDLLLNL